MTFGILTFISPWLLAGLATLPVIYWLLRTVPPRPKQIEFPPTRILKDVKNREKTPAKTPWWLLLIRLLAATLIILALAEPVINPTQTQNLKGTGPLAIIVDNGWSSAANWERRLDKVDRLITAAQNRSRPVIVIGTATTEKNHLAAIQSPSEARTTARALIPHPFAPNLDVATKTLKQTLASSSNASSGVSVLWLTDGIAHSRKTASAMAELSKIASGGSFEVISDEQNPQPLALASEITSGGQLKAIIKRAKGPARAGSVTAFSARNENLGQNTFRFNANQTETSITFDIPLELRNQVARLAIDGVRSAGSLSLLDARSKWRRVALISSEGAESAQPLLAPLYYLERALSPFAQLVKPADANLLAAIDGALEQNASVMIMADIGTLSTVALKKVDRWVKNGGILIRFAGPRMEKATDKLLPVPLRIGGRTLGGALSWSTPQKLSRFEDDSPFAGLTPSPEITISRQVLADPSRISANTKIWARLEDGTPLVTSSKRGDGELILFHVTANSDWSNLPMSGLFVEMLKRVLTLSNASLPSVKEQKSSAAGGSKASPAAADATQNSEASSATLLPTQTLNGYGDLQAPPPNAQPIAASEFAKTTVTSDHPPGYYGSTGTPRALNIASPKTSLKPLPPLPAGATAVGYGEENEKPLKPTLLAIALALIFIDMLAILFLQGLGARWTKGRANRARASSILVLTLMPGLALALGTAMVALTHSPNIAHAQAENRTPPLEAHAQQATNLVTLGYVTTGDEQTDTTSRLGLSGLGRVLARRTSVTPGAPIGIDIFTDEIAFFPILYWPLLPSARQLPEHVLAKVDAYMKQGGLIIFDTKDYGQGRPTGVAAQSNLKTPLQRLLGKLDIPRLEPVPPGHVITKSFYLLQDFPGRWAGGELWVEAGSLGSDPARGDRKTTATDGVTSIMITSNDFASAWAMDKRGRPIYPTVSSGGRQREMAFRTGINIVMHALTGNYKADQVHVPSLLQRLGQ